MSLRLLTAVLAGQASMNQLSFFLVIAVLFDTFVVSLFLIPAMMGILGSLNWFPKAMLDARARPPSTRPCSDTHPDT